jgi:MFS transporter, DHA2 family, multidrug resistance protein
MSSTEASGEMPRRDKWVVTVTVMLGTIMAVLDSSIVNVALPDMTASLGASVEQITWVVTGYILANVIIMPILGLLTARFGRRRFYLASVAFFTLASMACGLAGSLWTMVAARAIQGLGGGAMITLAQAILRETFPPEEQGMAMGLYGMGVVLAPAVGPTLGGWLTDAYSWPWVFLINVPLGALNLMMISRFIHDPVYLVREKGRIDWVGLALMIGGLGALQLLLEQGSRHDWFASSFIVALAIASGTGLLLFVWRELTTDCPAVDLRILKNVSFASATMIGGVLGMALIGSIFLLPLYLQNLLGFSAMDAGIAMMPRSLAMAVLMPLSGRLYNRVGPRKLVGVGLLVSAFGFWDLSHLTLDSGYWDLFFPQVWQGVGFSLVFVALSTAALATIDRPRMTAAAGLYNVVRQVFGSIGVSLAAAQLARGTEVNRAILAEQVSLYEPATRSWMERAVGAMQATGADAAGAFQRALQLLDVQIVRQASVLAYNHIFLLAALLFTAALPLVLLLSRARPHEVEMVAGE